jgi:predicted nucleic acid-binding protein
VIVADTNLIAYLLIRGSRTAEAESVYNKDPNWIAPLLWRSEFRNVLTLSVRRGLLKMDEAFDLMEQAEQLMSGHEHEVISSRILRLATDSGSSAYDCEFAALAQDFGVTLVTSDEAMIKKFKPVAVSMTVFCS